MRYFFLFLVATFLLIPAAMADELGEYHASLDRSCKTDADCAVKDIGNCCGSYPGCLNKNAVTDASILKEICEGVMSTCGFQEIKSCSCVQGECQPAATSGAVAQ